MDWSKGKGIPFNHMNKRDSEEAISRLWQESHLKQFFGAHGVGVNRRVDGPKLVQERKKGPMGVGGSKHGRGKLLACAKPLSMVQS